MLNERLREARKQKNYSQEYVAEKVHTSRQTVLRWENGTSEPGVETLKKLAELYDVSVNYLLEISENQAAPAPVESPDKSVHPAEKKRRNINMKSFSFLYCLYSLSRLRLLDC